MKQLVNNPVMVSLEIGLVQDILKIIGGMVQNKYGFCHDEIDMVKQTLNQKTQDALKAQYATTQGDTNAA